MTALADRLRVVRSRSEHTIVRSKHTGIKEWLRG